MKKIFILLMICLLMPGITVFATFDPYYPEEVITVYLFDNDHEGYYYDDIVLGYLDMLVKKDQVGIRMLPEISELFTTLHTGAVNTDYLDIDQEWISYTAYVENAFVFRSNTQPITQYTFASREEIIHFGRIKLVYFDELGNLMSETNEIMITPPSDEKWIEVDIRLNMDTGAYELAIESDEYVTGDWGNAFSLLFKIIFWIIMVIFSSGIFFISIFKIYEVIQKRRLFR